MDDEYYESMIDRMNELLGSFEDASNGELEDTAQSINIQSLYNIPMNSKIALYRARYASGFDDTDPAQFSYIHNANAIKQLRYNKAHEPVLYTATNPMIAYRVVLKITAVNFIYEDGLTSCHL